VSVRARILTFFVVLIALAGAGLGWVYSRVPIYAAAARLSVEPPTGLDSGQHALFPLQEAQSLQGAELTGVLAKIVGSEPSGIEPIVSASAIPQTTIVELKVEAANRSALVPAMQAWIDAYVASRKVSDQALDRSTLDQARRQVEALGSVARAKRQEADQFRRQHDIVSLERDENAAASRQKGTQAAVNEANNRLVNAEARLKTLSESLAEGRAVVRPVDKQALSGLEMRAVDLREKLRELELDYTPQYLSMDPKAKSLRQNLVRIEQQIERERERSQKAALAEAQEEVATARGAAARLREQMDSAKLDTVRFGERFAQLKRLSGEADQAEAALQAASEQLARVEAARQLPAGPVIRTLVPPTLAERPIRPDFDRDAMVAAGGALAGALLVVWLADFLVRPAQRSVEHPPVQPVIQIAYPMLPAGTGEVARAAVSLPAAGAQALLAVRMPRELAQDEIARMWEAANGQARVVVAALANGMTIDELAGLRWDDLDGELRTAQVRGASERSVPVFDPLRESLQVLRMPVTRVGSAVLCDSKGESLSSEDIAGLVTCAVRDAGLSHPEQIEADSIRHSFLAFLARAGARLGDLPRLAGWVAPAHFNEYGRLSPPGPGVPLASLDPVMPALRAVH